MQQRVTVLSRRPGARCCDSVLFGRGGGKAFRAGEAARAAEKEPLLVAGPNISLQQ